MNTPLRVGIVGCGNISGIYLQNARNACCFEVVGVAVVDGVQLDDLQAPHLGGELEEGRLAHPLSLQRAPDVRGAGAQAHGPVPAQPSLDHLAAVEKRLPGVFVSEAMQRLYDAQPGGDVGAEVRGLAACIRPARRRATRKSASRARRRGNCRRLILRNTLRRSRKQNP